MSEQPINQWNMTTEPSDMMKIQHTYANNSRTQPLQIKWKSLTMILSAMTVIKLYVANSSLIFTNLRLRLITTRYL